VNWFLLAALKSGHGLLASRGGLVGCGSITSMY